MGRAYVYVVENGPDLRVLRIAPTGRTVVTLAHFSPIVVGTPGVQITGLGGVAVDHDGLLYVTDTGYRRLYKLSPSGKLLARWDDPQTPNATPVGVTVDRQGHVYVADVDACVVEKLTTSLSLVATWGTCGHAPGQFTSPADVTTDARGNVYVADAGNHRIQKFSPNGEPLAHYGANGRGPGHFNLAVGVAIDQRGNIYVRDGRGNERGVPRIQKLSPTGRPLAQWGTYGSAPGQVRGAGGLAVDRLGHIYITDDETNRIEIFTATGKLLAIWQ